ncbi:MAG: response regulator [Chthoniobacterales bacterium]
MSISPFHTNTQKTPHSTVSSSKTNDKDSTFRILVVDDDPLICQINKKMLEYSGYKVVTATSALTGLKELQEKPYDLLITDNSMPEVTGLEMVKTLRARNVTLPIIMASGNEENEIPLNPELRISAFLLKPYTMPQLIQAVKDALWAALI